MKIGVVLGKILMLFVVVIISTAYVVPVLPVSGSEATFIATELLGCITDSSVTVNVLAEETLEVYFEYGTESGVYTGQTGVPSFWAAVPLKW